MSRMTTNRKHKNKMKHKKLTLLLFLAAHTVVAAAVDVDKVLVAGPYPITTPVMTDSLDAECAKLNAEDVFFDTPLPLSLWKEKGVSTDSILAAPEVTSLYVAGFYIENTGYAKCKVNVRCSSKNTLYIDGVKQEGEVSLVPGRHAVSLKLLQKARVADTLRISVETQQGRYISINPEGKRYWTLSDLMHGERLSYVSLSSSGKYLTQDRKITREGGAVEWTKETVEISTGRRCTLSGFLQWAASGDRYIRVSTASDGAKVYEAVDVSTGDSRLIGKYKGKGNMSLVADDTKLLIHESVDGPKEKDKDVHQVLQPDDRQPGWRNRTNVRIYDFATGIVSNVALGTDDSYASVSDDGSKILLRVRKHDITRRPFTFSTVLLLDAQTMKADTLVKEDGFLASCGFSPDGRYVHFVGSPEAFGGIGNTLPEGKIPNMFDYQLYLMDVQTREVTCLTRDFKPSVQDVEWCKADGNMYVRAENRDLMSLFRFSPHDGTVEQLNVSEPYIYSGYDVAREKAILSYTGESSQHSDRSWVVNLKNGKEKMLNDINPVRLDNIRLGECRDWNFVSERGDTIYGCYYLPPYFDESQQYPMLVYYYGGCSPVGRYLDSYYSYQEWAAMGYVVYVLQPSGCSGFGQEFASRHVNAYGDYTADDIIQGTKLFCKEHPYVKADKVGCLGASYGGFMTQYLLTKTDIFAAAMSHAGISNPASYWGFGYWGYSYNAVAAANSYPWNNSALYSGHAPLFNADKVHTPLLFMHGSADTNVPVNESIQMFTALKILGRETAFITVEGENHHILDYNKRIRWHDSIMAWFARWLHDDTTWWNDLYPEKNL